MKKTKTIIAPDRKEYRAFVREYLEGGGKRGL